MRVYYDVNDGTILYTIADSNEFTPPGDFIIVPENTVIEPMHAYRVQSGNLVDFDLDPFRTLLLERVNTEIGIVRSKYITVIPGQEMMYLVKEKQAADYLAASPEPNTVSGWELDYPSIYDEIGITADTAYNVAVVIVSLAAIWRDLGAKIDKARLTATKAISEASTRVELDTAYSNFQSEIGVY